MTVIEPETEETIETISVDGVPTSISDLPWWRRPRRLRRQLIGTLVAVAFISVALVGILNLVAARELLQEGTNDKLASIGEARGRSISAGIDLITSQASAAASDIGVVQASADLLAAYEDLDEELAPEQLAELDAWYGAQVVDPIADAGLPPVTLDDVVPASPNARYLQYHYVVADTDQMANRSNVTDAGDGSGYSAAHAAAHPTLRSVAESLGLGDLMIVSARTGEVVYSVDKRIDLGADLRRGPLAETALADTIRLTLPRVPVGDAVVVDEGIYIPGGGRPVVFVAAQIRQDAEVVGTLVGVIPIEALNRIATADGNWEDVGLDSGESYVVSADRRLRSESRAWLEDPEQYLAQIDDDELRGLVEAFGSPVGLQPVETTPVAEAFEGREFVGLSRNYLDDRTFTYATPIDVSGVDWVVVVDVPQSEARGPIADYAVRLGILLAIVLPVAGLIGYALANRLSNPIPPVVEAAFAVGQGERNPDLPDLGRDEFGDLARQLKAMASDLAAREAELEEEYEQTRRLLLTVVPPRIVSEEQGLDSVAEAGVATVIAVSVDRSTSTTDIDTDEITTVLTRIGEVSEQLADELGVERIRAAVDQSLFVAGLHEADDGADSALAFAEALQRSIRRLARDEDAPLGVRVGLATGAVAVGVLARRGLTFGVWGDPVRQALAIASLSGPDRVVVDDSTSEAATAGRWPLEADEPLVALDGTAIAVSRLAAADVDDSSDA